MKRNSLFKSVLFDLGGVIYDSPLLAVKRFEERLWRSGNVSPTQNHGEFPARLARSKAFTELESGKIARREFAERLPREIPEWIETSHVAEEMLESIEATTRFPNRLMLDVLDALRSKTSLKLGVITNDWEGCFDEETLRDEVVPRFEVFLQSHKLGLRKPDVNLYNLACARLGCEPRETISIDDIARNLKPARELGMTTLLASGPPPDESSALAQLRELLGVDFIPTEPHKVESEPEERKRIEYYLKRRNIISPTSRLSSPIRKFKSGQSNPTFLLEPRDDNNNNKSHAPSPRLVLRRKPHGNTLPTAHRIDREYKLISTIHTSDDSKTTIPVPKPIVLCEDDKSVVGSDFYLMEFVPSRCLQDPTLVQISSPETRAKMYDSLIETLANFHAFPALKNERLRGFGKPTNDFFSRQLKTWGTQTKQLENPRDEARFRACEKELDVRLSAAYQTAEPNETNTSLIHGDYRIDNVLFHPYLPRVVSMLDFELATFGHPYSDLFLLIAYHEVIKMGFLHEGVGDISYLERMLSSTRDESKIDGVPSPEEIVDSYLSKRALLATTSSTPLPPIPNPHDLMAFSYWKISAIYHGIHVRAKAGNASSRRAQTFGRAVPFLLQLAEKELGACGGGN